MELEINVKGMHCGGCENRVKNAVSEIKGVKEVVANHETGKVKIVSKKEIDLNEVKEKIERLDFQVVE